MRGALHRARHRWHIAPPPHISHATVHTQVAPNLLRVPRRLCPIRFLVRRLLVLLQDLPTKSMASTRNIRREIGLRSLELRLLLLQYCCCTSIRPRAHTKDYVKSKDIVAANRCSIQGSNRRSEASNYRLFLLQACHKKLDNRQQHHVCLPSFTGKTGPPWPQRPSLMLPYPPRCEGAGQLRVHPPASTDLRLPSYRPHTYDACGAILRRARVRAERDSMLSLNEERQNHLANVSRPEPAPFVGSDLSLCDIG